MKTILNISVLALLLTLAPSRCFALREIAFVSKQEAKEMGIRLEAQGSGPDQVWVELEFKAEGKFKAYDHVELEIYEGKKTLVAYAPLKDERSSSGSIKVRFLADRSYLKKITLSIVVGDLTEAVYELRVKDFVEVKINDAPEKRR
jgi:hypothetical protein